MGDEGTSAKKDQNPNHLRALDQQRLRRRFLDNLQHSKDRDAQKRQTQSVLQEYYWRMRDMEVEKNCRKIERTWQRREQQRQVGTNTKRKELAEKSDEYMNQQYGRILASPYSSAQASVEKPLPSQISVEQLDQCQRPASELEMESIFQAEALGVFQAAYHEALGRFVSPTPTEEKTVREQAAGFHESSLTSGMVDGLSSTSLDNSGGHHDPTGRLEMLPQGRVQWGSPRNPW